uniref:(northern house mosquito) hypothetical protein n=1 Tax=Culex pipiens TaxID=7175 RepID=A0A8D8K551_CULPI
MPMAPVVIVAVLRSDVLFVDLVLERGDDGEVDYLRYGVVVPVSGPLFVAFFLDDSRWECWRGSPVDVESRPAEPVHAVATAVTQGETIFVLDIGVVAEVFAHVVADDAVVGVAGAAVGSFASTVDAIQQ